MDNAYLNKLIELRKHYCKNATLLTIPIIPSLLLIKYQMGKPNYLPKQNFIRYVFHMTPITIATGAAMFLMANAYLAYYTNNSIKKYNNHK